MSLQVECVRESEVVDAVASGRWPDRIDAELLAHVGRCEVCSDVALVASAVDAEHEADRALSQARVPTAAHVWWRAQMRARREAARRAERPITVVQGVAAASAAGVAAAAVGYVSSTGWWAVLMQRIEGGGAQVAALPGAGSAVELLRNAVLGVGTAASALPHIELVVAAGLVLLLMPAALYFVLSDN